MLGSGVTVSVQGSEKYNQVAQAKQYLDFQKNKVWPAMAKQKVDVWLSSVILKNLKAP